MPRGSFPYPLLCDTDDVSSTFGIRNFSFESGVQLVKFTFELELDDVDLARHLESGAAELSVRWRCAQTLTLGHLSPTLVRDATWSQQYMFTIEHESIAKLVQLELQILASAPISNYHLSKQHPDYQNTTFNIATGSVLATSGQYHFDAKKLYDPLDPPLSACFQIELSNKVGIEGIELGFLEDEYVIIFVEPQWFHNISMLPPYLQLSSIVLPALISTLEYMSHPDDDDISQRSWHQSITTMIYRRNIANYTPLVQAQKLLENPIRRTSNEFIELISREV